MELERAGTALHRPASLLPLILLDTNAVLWLHQGHRRTRPLESEVGHLYVSPVSLLEMQFLIEAGRLRLRPGASLSALADDERWVLDDPPSGGWFNRALEIGWTRDPFDRLLIAHARLRGWRVATSDGELLDRLGPDGTVEL